jgi:type II secretory pathway pseudopilin PulG
LVELLVVIGIIAVMIGILLPVLRKAREAAQQVQCLSNLRQLSNAIVAYCNDNHGVFPGRAGQGTDGMWNTTDPTSNWGWISWRRTIDPISGVVNSANGAGGGFDQNITCCALARYLGSKTRLHPTPAEANKMDFTLEAIYRCPSDNLAQRPFADTGGRGAYRYSYSLNILFGNKRYDPVAGGLGNRTAYRRMNQVHQPAVKIMLIDESENSINNGECNPTPLATSNLNVAGTDYTAIAERHEAKNKRNSQDARGNVGCADGHAEFMSRHDAFDRRHFDPDYAG